MSASLAATSTTTKKNSPAAKSPTSSSKKSKKVAAAKKEPFDVDSLDVVLPTSSSHVGGGECSVLVQIDPRDATLLDFEGATGAIGRFEADNKGVTFDLKGCQYQGRMHPGPTALVLAVTKQGHLKVDGITDEFVTLQKTQDVMAKLDAVVVEGCMDRGYQVVDEDVNARTKQDDEKEATNKSAEASSGRKKRASSAGAMLSGKKRKATHKKK